MNTIGLIGGISWESTVEYYRIINETVKEKLGGFHSGEIVMYSFDFAEVEKLQHQGDWDELATMMVDAAERVKRGGAGFIVICANTMHKMADKVQESVGLPLVHIGDVTAESIKAKGMNKVGLLGTKFTMEEDFYKRRLIDKHGLDVIIPDDEERQVIHKILYDELCLGDINEVSKGAFKKAIDHLVERGAQGIILGCTEIPLIVSQEEYEIPLFDTTAIHARAAVDFALQ